MICFSRRLRKNGNPRFSQRPIAESYCSGWQTVKLGVRHSTISEGRSSPGKWGFGHVDPAAGTVKTVEITYIHEGVPKDTNVQSRPKNSNCPNAKRHLCGTELTLKRHNLTNRLANSFFAHAFPPFVVEGAPTSPI